jgi:hypothetical protein
MERPCTGNWSAFNRVLADFSASEGIELFDFYRPYLGHGYTHEDVTSPHYHPQDPTLWFLYDCTHANQRGNHEMRRLIWSQLRY